MNVYKGRLLKKSSNWKSKLVLSTLVTTLLSNIAFHLRQDRSSMQTCCFAQDSIRKMQFCSYVIFLLRDQWQIEILSEAMGAALVGNNFLPIPSKFSFHMKKQSDSLWPEIYKALKPCWLLNWVSIARVVACFPQASQSLPAASSRLWNALCLCSPVWPAQAKQESSPKSLAVDFAL